MAGLPYRVTDMDQPELPDDPGPPLAEPPSRTRRILTTAVLVAVIASIVLLAFTSGRGLVTVAPVESPASTAADAPTAVVATGRLAIVDSDGHLTTTDQAGGSVHALGEPGVAYAYPAWSPDGSHIAALGQADGARIDVFAVAPDGAATGSPATVYASADHPPFYLYWSPDGRRLTFLTTEPDGLALRLVPADGSAAASAIRAGSPMYWAWADADRMLVHSGGADPGAFFGETGPDGVSVEPATVEPGDFRAPGVTHDGRFRAYVGPGEGTPFTVVVEGRDRSDPHTLDVFGGAAIDFGPTGSELAFIAPAQQGRAINLPIGPLRLLDASTGDVRTILDGPVVAFYWAPNGDTIAALQVATPGDDNVADAAGIVLARAAVTRAPEGRPAAVAPGLALRLVFVDVASGAIRAQRSVQVGDDFAGQQLPFFDQYALSHRVWSADSRLIALPVADPDGTTHISVIAADGSAAVTIAAGVAASWSP